MRSVPKQRKSLIAPLVVALLILTTATASWAHTAVREPRIRAVRIVVPRAATPARLARPLTPVRMAPRPHLAVFQRPTKLPALSLRLVSTGLVQHCTASTYGYDYRGVPYSAASKEIPHGRHARVTAPNGRSVVVLINDSGPYVAGRCIDLSMTSMHALGYPEGLIDDVRVEELS